MKMTFQPGGMQSRQTARADDAQDAFKSQQRSVFSVYLSSPLKAGSELIALEVLDRAFHPGRICTWAWDVEWHFWRTFDGLDQYRKEAQADGFYESLAEVDIWVTVHGVEYLIVLDLCSTREKIRIEFDCTVSDPYDFGPIMEELDAALGKAQI